MVDDETLIRLNQDLLVEILARADGPDLASAACACTDLRRAAGEKSLWQGLCHATWPSSLEEKAKDVIASTPGGFAQFYSNSLPLLLYKPDQNPSHGHHLQNIGSPSEFVSLIDVFYRGVCIFSKAVHGIPTHDICSWFLDWPLRLKALGEDDEAMEQCSTSPIIAEGEEAVQEAYERLEEVRLSWVVMDPKSGVAVNVSSWRPTSVQRNWPIKRNVLMTFGCVVAMDQQMLAHEVVECVIEVKLRVCGRGAVEELRMVEVGLQMEDADGMHISGRESLMVLHRALSCSSRSRNSEMVMDGYLEFKREQDAAHQRRYREERKAQGLRDLARVAIFALVFLSCNWFSHYLWRTHRSA